MRQQGGHQRACKGWRTAPQGRQKAHGAVCETGHAMAQGIGPVSTKSQRAPRPRAFKNVDDIHVVGIFPNYASAYDAWKNEAQRTVDNAHMRYFIAHLHRLRDEEAAASSTEELG